MEYYSVAFVCVLDIVSSCTVFQLFVELKYELLKGEGIYPMTKQRQLKTEPDFERMMVFQQPINIYQEGILIDQNVIIKSHNKETVVSSTGERYFKSACMFIRA